MSIPSKRQKSGITYFKSALFDSFSIPHMFAASRGGVSCGDFSSLNISLSRKDRNGICDTLDNVSHNLLLCLEIIGENINGCAMMEQIHSSLVCPAEFSFFDSPHAHKFDGVFTDGKSGIRSLCVKTADCVPVLLYELNNDVACAIHAGWRGTVFDICGNAVRAIKERYSDCRFIAAIGPHARECCYEVDDTVYLAAKESFKKSGIQMSRLTECFSQPYFKDGNNRYRVNLSNINRIFLENAGLSQCDIEDIPLCTCCLQDQDGPLFFSHRASGGFSGTQASIIAVR